MENVGKSQDRNIGFNEKFNRGLLLQHLVENNQPIIFDVGAHHGESVKFFKKHFPSAYIHSFEPDPESFSILSKHKIKAVTYHNFALSNKDGKEIFYRNNISHTNSLLKVNINSKDSIGVSEAVKNNDKQYFEKFNNEIHVETVRLDSFVKENEIKSIDILKIDVQGTESQVLVGAEAVLKNIKVLVMELSFFDYYEHQTSFLDVEKILIPLGFTLFSISEISNNPMNGRTDWAEVIYLRSDVP